MVIRIGMVGTFDVANFGDLLFPLIAHQELSRRLGPVEIRPYSYNARSAPPWPFAVSPVERLAAEIVTLDLLLVGGGDIIRFDPLVALNYRPGSADIHHPTGFWLGPIFLAHTAKVPVAWNAPGVPLEIPSWAHALVRASLAVSSYVSVRDETSRDRLIRAAGDARVEVVPDSAFNAAILVSDPPVASDYLVVQSRPESSHWVHRVRELLRDDRSDFVIAPVGPVTGDLVHPPAKLPPNTTFRYPEHPNEMLKLIAGSKGVVGPSLHLTIAALSLGRPAWRPRSSPLTKYRMLDGLKGVQEFEMDPAAAVDRLPADPSQLSKIRKILERHWDAIAALAGAAATRGPRRKWEPMMMDLWQSLPARFERRSFLSRLRTKLQIAKTMVARYRYRERHG
jgi:lipopolysaccharide transport system ATP-binding protein